MSSIWDYPTRIALSTRNLVGFEVEALDGHLGTIDEASVVCGQAHLVVDTGFWLLGKKRMIPAGVIERIDEERETVYVGLSREQVQSAPDFDARRRDERDEYDIYYGGLAREATSKVPACGSFDPLGGNVAPL